MARDGETVSRRVDGFVWLSRHARRAEIVAYVTGGKDAPPLWLTEDRVWPKVRRDRAVWKVTHPAGGGSVSLRDAADRVSAYGIKVSYQTVQNVLEVYADGGPDRPADAARLKLKTHARKAITREVLAQYDAGEITAGQVAELIGHGADYRNAVYWVERMRELYAEPPKAETPKRVRRSK